MKYFCALAHERFPPDDLPAQAPEAEQVWLGAAARQTKRAQPGRSIVALMNVSGADPNAALRVYGEQVLPQLRA